MNAILIQIIVALYSFIVTNPNIPQSVKDKALQVVGEHASEIQMPASSCSTDTAQVTGPVEQTQTVSSSSNTATVAPAAPTPTIPSRPQANDIDVPGWNSWPADDSAPAINATVNGIGFVPGDTVSITGHTLDGYVPVTVNGVSTDGTQIFVTLPAGLPTGNYGYYVFTSDGTQVFSYSTGFGLRSIDQ